MERAQIRYPHLVHFAMAEGAEANFIRLAVLTAFLSMEHASISPALAHLSRRLYDLSQSAE